MEAVADPLRVGALLERGADRAGLAVVDARHCVEGVGERARAGIEARAGLLVGGVGVADRDGDAHVRGGADVLERAGELGRDGDADRGGAERAELVEVRRTDAVGVLGALLRHRDVRALQVDAREARAGDVARRGADALEVLAERRHRRREPRRRAVLRAEDRHLGEVGVHRVEAEAAVRVDVDEARDGREAAAVDVAGLERRGALLDAGDAVAVEDDRRRIPVNRYVGQFLHGRVVGWSGGLDGLDARWR